MINCCCGCYHCGIVCWLNYCNNWLPAWDLNLNYEVMMSCTKVEVKSCNVIVVVILTLNRVGFESKVNVSIFSVWLFLPKHHAVFICNNWFKALQLSKCYFSLRDRTPFEYLKKIFFRCIPWFFFLNSVILSKIYLFQLTTRHNNLSYTNYSFSHFILVLSKFVWWQKHVNMADLEAVRAFKIIKQRSHLPYATQDFAKLRCIYAACSWWKIYSAQSNIYFYIC